MGPDPVLSGQKEKDQLPGRPQSTGAESTRKPHLSPRKSSGELLISVIIDNKCATAKSPSGSPNSLLACGMTCSVCVSRSQPCPSPPRGQPAPHLLHDVPVLGVHLS